MSPNTNQPTNPPKQILLMMNSDCSGSITKYSTPLQMKDTQIRQNTDETSSFYQFKIRHQKVSYQFYTGCMMTTFAVHCRSVPCFRQNTNNVTRKQPNKRVQKGWFQSICAAIWETKVLFTVSFSHSQDPVTLHIFQS